MPISISNFNLILVIIEEKVDVWDNFLMNSNESQDINVRELNERPVLVVGIVKNIEKTLKKDIQILSKALGFFREIHWFLVESESNDKSVSVLSEFKKTNNNFDYQSLGTSLKDSATRTDVMAAARNAYLAYLREKLDQNEFPYVVVADFNLLNNKLSRNSVLTSWSNDNWDVVTANQSGPYYDIWALRHPLWAPNDCWEHHSFIRNYVRFPESALTFSIRSRMLRINKKSNWIKVDSSFGGFAIYKSQFLLMSNYYEGLDENGKMVCEHVTFHKKLTDNGARIFINPAMINTKYTDHSRQITFWPTVIRFIKNLKKLV
jgi:hypothetical protein